MAGGVEGPRRTGQHPSGDERAPSDAVVAVVGVVAYLLAALWAKEISLPGSVLIWFPPAGVAIALAYLRPRLAIPVVIVAELVSTPVIMGLGQEYGALPLVVNAVGLALA
jgi:hypothetical protein